MSLSEPSIDVLTDLVEIKLAAMEIYCQDDAREFRVVQRCREELRALKQVARRRGRTAARSNAWSQGAYVGLEPQA